MPLCFEHFQLCLQSDILRMANSQQLQFQCLFYCHKEIFQKAIVRMPGSLSEHCNNVSSPIHTSSLYMFILRKILVRDIVYMYHFVMPHIC